MKIPSKRRWAVLINEEREMELTSIRGFHFLNAEEEELSYRPLTQSIELLDGEQHISNFFDPFNIKLNFYFEGYDYQSYQLLLQEIRQLLAVRGTYYIAHSDLPMYRYPVNQMSIESEAITNGDAKISLSFRVYKGYKESISNTLDDFSTAENWGFGMGIDVDIPPYTNSAKAFEIFNAGFDIDPRMYHQLKVAFSGKVEKELIVTNKTTSDVFRYTGKLTKDNTLLLDGVYPYLDNARCGRSTNNGILRLNHGLNNITVEGATDFKISFAFHYLYR